MIEECGFEETSTFSTGKQHDVKIKFYIYCGILQQKKESTNDKVIFVLCNLIAKQLPNYRNSLGMRPNFRFLLLFMEV